MRSIRWAASVSLVGCIAVAGCGGPVAATAPSVSNPIAVASLPASGAPVTLAPQSPTPEATTMPTAQLFVLTSSAFADGAAIPRRYTCQGADVSPALAWTGQPAGTGQLLLIVDDPDAHGFVHWTILIGDGADVALSEAYPPDSVTAKQGINGFGRVGYGGPCPPSGTHHYRFTMYALSDALQGLPRHPTISEFRTALRTVTILAQTTLTGTYRKT